MVKRRITIILFSALLCVLGSIEIKSANYQLFGVAFYNLENLFDTINNNGKYDLEFSPEGKYRWDGQRYKSKLKNMAYAISKLTTKHTPSGPAIIGVSEIENKSVLDDLVKEEAIKDLDLKVIHHDSPDRRGVDVGMLYNPKYFRPLRVTNHTLKVEGLPDFRTRDQMCVVGLLGGERIGVIINHWPSRRGGREQSSYLREAAAELSKQIADSLLNIDPNMGVIILGDLNDDPQDKSCSMVLGAKKKQSDVAAGGFYNPFWAKLDSGIGSYCYRGGWNLFDQIIINYNLISTKRDVGSKLRIYDSRVHNEEFLKQQDGPYKGYPHRTFSSGAFLNGYSDHFPTQIILIKENK